VIGEKTKRCQYDLRNTIPSRLENFAHFQKAMVANQQFHGKHAQKNCSKIDKVIISKKAKKTSDGHKKNT